MRIGVGDVALHVPSGEEWLLLRGFGDESR